MKKTLVSAIIIVLAVVVVLGAAKNIIAKVSVEKGVEAVTGLPLKMKSFDIGIIKTFVKIDDLRLFNSPGYKDKIMLEMPEIYVDYDLPAIFKGKIHLKDVRIDLKEFVVVKNASGNLNLDALKPVQQEKGEAKPAEEPAKKKGKAPEMQIDSLELKIGKVIYKDYSKGGEPTVTEYQIGIDERYSDITDPNKLVALIVVKALMNTTVGRLTGFDMGGLQDSVSGTLSTAQEVTGQAAAAAQATAKKTTEAAVDTVKDTADSVKESFKMPFGGKN